MPNIRRTVELFRRLFNQCSLHANGCWYLYRDVSVVVMIDRAHGKHALADKEGWFAMRQFLCCLGEFETHFADTLNMLCARWFCSLRRLRCFHETLGFWSGGSE